jgi:hypothetical protein
MTENDWLNADNPEPLVAFAWENLAAGTWRQRKYRLLAVACCRRIQELFEYDEMFQALDIAERHADGHALEMELRCASAELVCESKSRQGAPYTPQNAAIEATSCALMPSLRDVLGAVFTWSAGAEATGGTAIAERPATIQAELARCVFGNPFRSVTFAPDWRTPDVMALARTIYEERAFDLMPVLGDALEDAGCTDPDILDHCRGDDYHTRGCWVVDLILGKK